MRYIRLVSLLLLLLLPAVRLSAQWSGNVDATGGYGAVKSLRGQLWEEMPKAIYHGLWQGSGRINYNSPTFMWTSYLEGRAETKATDNYHFTLLSTDKQSEDGFDLRAIVKMNEEIPVNAQFRTEATWLPKPGQRYVFWARYNINYKQGNNLTYRASWKSLAQSLSQESPVTQEHTAEGGVRMTHELGPSRRPLFSEFSFNMNDKYQETIYSTINVQSHEQEDDDDFWMSSYKLTPHSRISTVKANVNYRDTLLRGATHLMINPGIRFTGIRSIHENSGATLDVDQSDQEKEVWRDSIQIREWFRFASLDFQPNLVADFSWRSLRIRADYALMLYARKLTDSTHFAPYKWQEPYVLGNGRIDWRISPQHMVSVSNNLSVHHPTYLQVCWFDRSGGYMEQLYRGSESLRSTRTQKYSLSYEFKYKRFVASASSSYTRRGDEIEQTWFKEEIDSRTYKVFTWLNGADSRIYSVAPRLGWRGKVISANMGMDYNHTIRTWRESGKVKISNDWRLTSDISARLPKGWTFSADMRYQSAVATFFALFKQYCVLNARIQKDFKRFSIHMQGRDLLDKPVESEYISEDETEYWTESTLHNRRLILLGINWKF